MRHAFRFLSLLLLAACFTPLAVNDAQEAKKEDPKPHEFKKPEILAAAKYLKAVGPERVMLINGLRYLCRPDYEPALMEGRAYVPCGLPPQTAETDECVELLEALRLLVIIESGMPFNEFVERDVVRFLNTETLRVNDSLANYAVPLVTCLAAIRDKRIKHTKLLKEKAAELMENAMKARDVTDHDSPLIKGDFIEPMWYANQMWRALMARCCLELDIGFSTTVWKTNLMDLSGACNKDRGWMSGLHGDGNPDNDLNSNALALTAISLALQAPGEVVPDAAVRSLEKRLKYVPEVLQRIDRAFPDEIWQGGRLCLARDFRDDFAPKRQKWADWYKSLLAGAVEHVDPSGAVLADHNLAHAMGLDVGMAPRHAKKAAETGLGCLALCGGLWHEKGMPKPLEGMSQAEIDTTMQCLSILHAASLPPIKAENEEDEGDEDPLWDLPLDEQVQVVIERGCKNLESIQLANGTFSANGAWRAGSPGLYEVAMAMAALVHGGRKQDAAPVRKAFEYCISELSAGVPAGLTTYELGMILYGFQCYYMKNLEDAGMFKIKNRSEYAQVTMKTWNSISPEGHRIIGNLANALKESYIGGERGGWSYHAPASKGGGASDNSNSQFGMLGYKAAATLGAPVDIKIFENEARRLVAQYGAAGDGETVAWKRYDNKGDYEHVVIEQPDWPGNVRTGGWSYGCWPPGDSGLGSPSLQYNGTGMMELAMARDELLMRNVMPNGLRRQIDTCIFGAQAWLADNFYKKGELSRGPRQTGMGGAGWGLLYNMWAIERGCVTANYPLLRGKIDWYTMMAEALVRSQRKDGSWGTPHDTAVCILILRKVATPMPGNPRPKPGLKRKPVDPVTPEPKKPKTEEEWENPVTGNRKRKKDVTRNEEPEPDPEPEPEPVKPNDPVTPGGKR